MVLRISKIMKQKVTLSLDKELIEFLDLQAKNRSEYLNELLLQKRSQVLADQIKTALQEDVNDPNYLADIQAWDVVAGDGLDA
jgi:metal-responsive CopG/Arc/MetJ family transcriptional regulator